MLQFLPALDAYLWLTTAAWQIVVAAIVVFRLSFRRAYPAFSSFACFAAIRSVILMLLPAKWYFWGYSIGSTATSFLIGATLFELYIRVCGPHFSLPAWVPRTMASWLTLAVSASIVASIGLYNVRVLEKRAAVLAATQGGMLMARYGKGIYIYSGYAFFRQLPAGVPGAIRLFVNLVSVGHQPQPIHSAATK